MLWGLPLFLGIACFEIITGALNRIIFGGDPVKIGGSELWLLIIVLGINIFVAFYERKVGYKIGSKILIADATHTMSDVWITISVLFGLIGVWQSERLNLPQLQYLDILLAFPVAFFSFKKWLASFNKQSSLVSGSSCDRT